MRKPPTWFRVVAVLLVLWGVAACASYVAHVRFDPDDPANPVYDRQLYKSLPAWLTWIYAVAVGTTLAGAVALLARKRLAVPFFAVSLVAVVVQFGWTLAATDLIAAKGLGIAAGPPAFIVGLTAFGLWLSARARRRGWIG